MVLSKKPDIYCTLYAQLGGIVSGDNKPEIYVAWKTVTYRSVALIAFSVLIITGVALHFAFPQFTHKSVEAVGGLGKKLLDLFASSSGGAGKGGAPNAQQAHITALDGTVRVKKAGGNTWLTADYNIPLEKGDIVQTGSEGMAKIVFTDGTNYTVKQDSLIVIEENSANDQQQTNVAVAVSTGTVDLHTGGPPPGSKSQVVVAGATASLGPDSAARVHSDPKADQHEILLEKGTGDVVRNGETVHLASWDKVAFQGASPRMAKLKEIGPPTPIAPANMMPIFMSKESRPVEFSWTAMANAAGYRLRISRNPFFSSTVVDRKVNTADVVVSGLGEGAYYWMIQSFDAAEKESIESEKNRFTIIARGKETRALNLELDPLVQHGHVLELVGKTESGARVMVNGQEVPVVGADGVFHYFTPPLPLGESLITITAQNKHGGVNTLQKRVVIQ